LSLAQRFRCVLPFFFEHPIMKTRQIILALALLLSLISWPGAMLSPPTPSATGHSRCWGGESMPLKDPDQQFLEESKVATDGPGLLNYLRERSAHDDDLLQVDRLIRQLGGEDFQRREEASRRLIAVGPPAHALLLKAQKDKDKERARRARECAEDRTQ
jgi:hypothetical protein